MTSIDRADSMISLRREKPITSIPPPESKKIQEPAGLTPGEKYTMVTLCFVNIINYMDRYCVAGVLVQIQGYYSIADDMAGLLQTGFVIAYTIFSPLFGYLGDRYSRRWLLIVCILFWSSMTVAGSFANTYTLFFAARTLVGAGEAGFSVIAPAVISDTVSSGSRTIILAVFYLAIPFGSGLGYVVSGKIAQLTGVWWWGLRVSAFFGVAGATMLYFGVYPNRGEKEARRLGGRPSAGTSYTEDLRCLLRNPSFMLASLACTTVSFISGAVAWWAPKCIYYGFKKISGAGEVELGDVAFKFGLITMLTGILGVTIGALLSKYLRPRIPFIDPIICAAGQLTSLPFLIFAILQATQNQLRTYILIFAGELCFALSTAIVTDILMYVVVPRRRALAGAICMVMIHAMGDSVSPYIIGVLSEHLKRTRNCDQFEALAFSLLMAMSVVLAGGILFLTISCFVVEDRRKADAEMVVKAGSFAINLQ